MKRILSLTAFLLFSLVSVRAVDVMTPAPDDVGNDMLALARNLENDPKRIYDFVHNTIRYTHYFGSKKGALLTLLEGSGNDFDQCALLVALLRAAAANNPSRSEEH